METVIGKDTDEISKEFFSWILCRYQISLEDSIKGKEFRDLTTSDTKIGLNCGGSYIFFWFDKNQKATINSKNCKDVALHYAATVLLNYKKLKQIHKD